MQAAPWLTTSEASLHTAFCITTSPHPSSTQWLPCPQLENKSKKREQQKGPHPAHCVQPRVPVSVLLVKPAACLRAAAVSAKPRLLFKPCCRTASNWAHRQVTLQENRWYINPPCEAGRHPGRPQNLQGEGNSLGVNVSFKVTANTWTDWQVIAM